MVTMAAMNTVCGFVLNKEVGRSAKRLAKEQVATSKNSIASINHDFDAMVFENDKKLTETMIEMKKARDEQVTVRASVEEVETRTVRLYKKSFTLMPEYSCLVPHFIEARDDQLTKMIQAVHL
ncbi:hypothetical protein Adt_03863 [Abeliophyllum distichum]|uniref:Uncharacterized protein n=1 Tax=Abeliophyllum distichum TaxID=126358 RepID=A0ABD1W338_9LAMI